MKAQVSDIWTTEAVIFSLKTFAAAMLAYWIAVKFNLNNPYWSVGTVYIVAHPLMGATTSKAVYRMGGTILGAIAIIILVPNLVSSPELLSVGMALWTAGCLFISMLDRSPKSYLFMLAGYTAVLTGSTIVDTPGTTFDVAVSRVEEIFVGILCIALFSRGIFPQKASQVLSRRVDLWLENANALTRDVLSGSVNSPRTLQLRQTLAADAVDLRNFATHVGYESHDDRRLAERMTILLERMVTLLPLLSEVYDLRMSTISDNQAKEWFSRVSGWLEEPADNHNEKENLLSLFSQAQNHPHDKEATWDTLYRNRLAGQLHELTEVWSDCLTLRRDITSGEVHETDYKPRRKVGMLPDYGMAFLSAAAVCVSIILACSLWVLTGWSYGSAAVQMVSVICCTMATLDDAVPVVRKMLELTLATVGISFVYQFGIFPFIESLGFIPLISSLGLFLIPVGVLLATPSKWFTGFVLSVNLVFMLQLRQKLTLDLPTFLNANIATVAGIVIAIMTLSTFRTIGAETSVRRLLKASWRMIVQFISSERRASDERMTHHILNQLGLLVPRMAAVPPESDIYATDLLRDLRAGLCVMDIQNNKISVTVAQRDSLEQLLLCVAAYYKGKINGQTSIQTQLEYHLNNCLQVMSGSNDGQPVSGPLIRNALAGLHTALLPLQNNAEVNK